MPQNKKVFANLFSRVRGSQDKNLKCVVEYVILEGVQRSGKFTTEIGPLQNEGQLQDDLKESLAVYLSTLYAPESFSSINIVGIGV